MTSYINIKINTVMEQSIRKKKSYAVSRETAQDSGY